MLDKSFCLTFIIPGRNLSELVVQAHSMHEDLDMVTTMGLMGINHILPFFTAPAVFDLAAVFGNPVFILGLIFVSFDSSSGILDAHPFSVFLNDEMDFGDISPQGFSGLAVQVFDGILVGTVCW